MHINCLMGIRCWDSGVAGGRNHNSRSATLQFVDYALVVVTRFAKLIDVFISDVLVAFRGFFEELKACGPGVLKLPVTPLLLALEILYEVHHALVLL